MDLLLYLLAAAVSAVIFFLFRNRVLGFLKQKGITATNYSGREVLTGGGLLLLFPCLFASIPALFATRRPDIVFYMIMIPALAFCGMLDDLLGDSSAKGLAGHAGRFLRGGLSTGWIKALMGGMIGMLLAWSRYQSLFLFLLDTVSFALCVNLVNLLDLRPGRAIKGFLIVLLPVTLFSGFHGLWVIIPVVSSLALYLGGEMEESYMLGDTGANLLGGVLGFYQVTGLPFGGKIVLASLLILIHVLAEFQSLSKLIDAVPVLRKIDRLGGKKEK